MPRLAASKAATGPSRPGLYFNLDVDGLSRNPNPSTRDRSVARADYDREEVELPAWSASAMLLQLLDTPEDHEICTHQALISPADKRTRALNLLTTQDRGPRRLSPSLAGAHACDVGMVQCELESSLVWRHSPTTVASRLSGSAGVSGAPGSSGASGAGSGSRRSKTAGAADSLAAVMEGSSRWYCRHEAMPQLLGFATSNVALEGGSVAGGRLTTYTAPRLVPGETSQQAAGGDPDVWSNLEVLEYLQRQEHPSGRSKASEDRVQQRAQRYRGAMAIFYV
eukprot:SM000043S15811  [mRNA]  locus=s43:240387:241229:- [translate_table: standard]